MRVVVLILLFCVQFCSSLAQKTDTLPKISVADPVYDDTSFATKKERKAVLKPFILPMSLFASGVVFSQVRQLSFTDIEIARFEQRNFRRTTELDNYLQFAPAVVTMGLDAVGIKGKHSFKQKLLLLALSSTLPTAFTHAFKYGFQNIRPDSTSRNSFPSGHTAAAFAGAEFLATEYGDQSSWYRIAGYTAAGLTGILRVYNNRHWFSDIVAGAGVGILSTRLAYWAYPVFEKIIFKKKEYTFIPVPFYNGYAGGINLVIIQGK